MKIIVALLLSCAVIPANSQPKQPSAKDIEEKIRLVENNLISWVKFDNGLNSNIHERMKDLKISGVSIAVIDNYRIEWAKSYGWADTATKKPVDNNTLFQIASIGKSLNAFGQMTLVQKGKVLLEEDINHYLNRWKFPYDSVSKGKKITLANLLSHTAGLSVHGFDGYEWNEPLPTILQTLNGQKPANNPPVRSEFEPGIKSEYSGGGIMISQVMMEDITKMSYNDYMKKAVFGPLRMTNTSFSTDPPSENFSTGYRFDGKHMAGKYMRFSEQACGGAAWSTASDLAKFIIEIQLSLKNQSNKVLKKETIQKMLTPYLAGSNSAFGFFIDDKKGDQYFQHSGLNPGYSSQFYGSMEGGRGVVVLVNSDMTDFMAELVNSVATVYNWKNFYDYTRKQVVEVPEDTLKKYAGNYKFEGAENGPIILYENGQLYLKDPQSSIKWRLYFTSNTEFFMIEARWANQKFYFDKEKVNGFTITTGTYNSKVIRTN